MKTEELYVYTLKKVNKNFNNPELIKGEVLGFNGAFILHFSIDDCHLNFCADRGFIDVYLFVKAKDKGIMIQYPQIANKLATPENIDFIVNFLYDHKNEIFKE